MHICPEILKKGLPLPKVITSQKQEISLKPKVPNLDDLEPEEFELEGKK